MGKQLAGSIYQSILISWAIAMTWTLAFGKPWIALSITFGMLVTTASLAVLDKVVSRAFVPGSMKARRALIKWGLVKYPVIAIIIYVLSRWQGINLLAFCGGIVLVHFAIVAKIIGINRMEEREARRAGIGT